MNLTPEQFQELMKVLHRIAEKQYTITGSADWPLLVALCSVLSIVLFFAIGMTRKYLEDQFKIVCEAIKSNKLDWQNELKKHEESAEKEKDYIWNEIRDIKSNCKFCIESHKKHDDLGK